MTEREKMLSGALYDTSDAELYERRKEAHILNEQYNATREDEKEKRTAILKRLLPHIDETAFLQGPLHFDYGDNTYFGKNFYANFNLTVLDCAAVTIGDNVMIGPNCSIVTAIHPLTAQERNYRFKDDGTPYTVEYAKPVTIGDNCWIASNVTIIGGVKIGNGCVIGAGAVVTKDILDNSLAVGNPCKVIRQITEKDKLFKN